MSGLAVLAGKLSDPVLGTGLRSTNAPPWPPQGSP